MTGDSDNGDEVLLSAEHVRHWIAEYGALKTERASIHEQIKSLQSSVVAMDNKLNALNIKIRQAAPFYPKISEWMKEEDDQLPENVALTKAILRAVMAIPNVDRNHLRAVLPQFGYPAQKMNSNPNYIYTALGRLGERKLIVEIGGGRFVLTDMGQQEARKP